MSLSNNFQIISTEKNEHCSNLYLHFVFIHPLILNYISKANLEKYAVFHSEDRQSNTFKSQSFFGTQLINPFFSSNSDPTDNIRLKLGP